jgi:hypothetical protein
VINFKYKTNINLKIRYKEHISEIKLKKIAPNLNFCKYILKNNYNIHYNIKTDLEILNTQVNVYINLVLEQLYTQ